MNVEKLKSVDVGTHHPVQAIIFTDGGEIFVTKNETTAEGFELVKFQTYDLSQLTSIVNNILKGNRISSMVTTQVESNTLFASSIANLFRMTNYVSGTTLHTIIGGRAAQPITLMGDGTSLTITTGGNLQLAGDMVLATPFSTLMLQKVGDQWIELSRKHNN